ncbi:MAG TPA: ABC transporter permease subunit [Stellaceae bacterium]|jgi:putrescine transport system permease protein|nr:ABC transporter permease subunit [Stellaceae bacterium]
MTGIGIWQRRLLIGLPFLWLAVFFLLPLAMVAGISVTESADAIPPFEPLLRHTAAGWQAHATFASYRELAEGCLRVYVNSLANAGLATLLCLVMGYPIAFAIVRAPAVSRHALLFLVMLPFWTSFLIRVYAWIAILQPSGLINRLLIAGGLIETPLPLLYNGFSVVLGLVYSYLPFMILPLYGSLSRLDEALVEAAADLGAPPWRVFLGVVLPLTLPGIAAGTLLVFIPAIGEFVIPDLLGGPDTLMIGKLLWQEFFDNVDWPAASAVAMALVAVVTLPLLLAQRVIERQQAG